MKKLLKIFPDKSSGLNDNEIKSNEIIKTEIINEVTKLKKEISFEEKSEIDYGFKILSQLFKFLRDSKDIKLLTICRQFKNIQILDNTATIIADDNVLEEICGNQEISNRLNEFFKNLDLSLKINKKNENISTLDKLREWLGEKIIIR